MSRDVQQYWREVRSIEERLPEFVWLAAEQGAADVLTEVPALLAARLLQAKSHRLATNEEVDAHHAREAASVKSAKRERMRRSGAAVVVVEEPAATSEPSPRRRR